MKDEDYTAKHVIELKIWLVLKKHLKLSGLT